VRTLIDDVSGHVGVIILNAGLLHNVGPFRLHVEIATVAAECGIPTIRIDQSGKGESHSRLTASRLDALFQDYEEAFSALAEAGIEATVLVGLCSGADDALQIADRYDSVAGLVLLDGYARRTVHLRLRNALRRIRKKATDRIRSLAGRDTHENALDVDLRAWTSDEEMLGLMRRLLDSGKRILAVFTAGQGYYDHAGQLAHDLSVSPKVGNLHEIYFKEADHTYSRVAHRRALLEEIRSWLAKHFQATV
jgi:pimeloyl-ACP methyl ester carboxylesterase